MRTLFGMVLGCFLTIGIVYLHDTQVFSAERAPAESRQIVNWDVAASKWSRVKTNAREAWTKLTANVG